MNLQEARAWIESPAFIREMTQLDDEAEAAVNTMNRTISGMGMYSSATQGEYRRAGGTVDSTAVAFNSAINDISNSRVRDGRAATAAFRAYIAAVRRLQGLNARNAAMVEADVATLWERFFAAGAALQSGAIRRETRAMRRDLERLQANLRSARRESLGAEAQRAINLVLGGIGLALGLATGVDEAAAAFTVGSAALSTALDTALGPGTPDMAGGANTGVGLIVGLAEGVPRAISNFTGIGTTFIGWLADNAEVEAASRNLASARTDLERAIRIFRDYARHIASTASQLTIAKALADGALRTARARAARYREATTAYRDMERGLADIRGI